MSHAFAEPTLRSGQRIHVIQGGREISADPEACLSTVLGSCVSACLYDPVRGVGGMNHFLLAEGAPGDEAMRYGAYAMEMLINDLMKAGAARERLQAKLFGGAKMFEALQDVGAANASFARRFLATEGIPVVSESLGGRHARRVEFWPVTGRARQRETVATAAVVETRVVLPAPADDSIELF